MIDAIHHIDYMKLLCMVKKIGSYRLEWKTWRLNATYRRTCSKWLITCVRSLWRSLKLYHFIRWSLWHIFLNKCLILFLSLRCQMWGVEWTNDFVLYLHPQTRLVWFIGEIMYLAKLEWNHLNWSYDLNFS